MWPAATASLPSPGPNCPQGPEARLGVYLRGRKIQVSQELLHLVDGYEPTIKQDRRDGMTKQVRINAFLYARRTGAVGYD